MDFETAIEAVAEGSVVARHAWTQPAIVRLCHGPAPGLIGWVSTQDIEPQDILAEDWFVLGTLQ